jgi:hypothetical protein
MDTEAPANQPLNDITTRESNNINLSADHDMGESLDGIDKAEKSDDIDPSLMKITHERYTNIAETIVIHLRDAEERNVDDPDWEGVRRSQLVEWFYN